MSAALPLLPPDPSDSAIGRFVEGYRRFTATIRDRARLKAELHYLDKMLGALEGVETRFECTRLLQQRWAQRRADMFIELFQRGWL